MKPIGNSHVNPYILIINKRKVTKFHDKNCEFQLYRKGHYKNLILDLIKVLV